MSSSSYYPLEPDTSLHRTVSAVGAVVLLHVASLWAVQYAMDNRPVKEEVEPAVLLTELIFASAEAEEPAAAPAPPAPPAPPPPPPPPEPKPQPKPKPAPPKPKPKPQPKPIERPAPITERTPIVAPEPPPEPVKPPPEPVAPAPAPTPVASPVTGPASSTSTSATSSSASTSSSNSSASQGSSSSTSSSGSSEVVRAASNSRAALNNPRIPYPPISRRMREEGLVTLRVLVGANGAAKDVKIKTSSGYARLDNAARDAALRSWRFTPSKRGGVPFDDWYDIPVRFKLTD